MKPPARVPEAGHPRLTTTAIVPTFNRARYIGACLESLLGQTRPPDEVIVVDDGSTDGTDAIVRGFGDAVTLLAKPNGGKSTALNLALPQATGDAIWIFDDDDVAAPDALAILAGALEDRSDAGFSYGAYSKFTGEHPDPAAQAHPNFFPIDASVHLNLLLMEENFIMQPGMLVRRACYETVGPFDTALVRSQDYDMLLRLSRRFAAVRVANVVFHQRQHGGSRGSAAAPVPGNALGSAWARYDRAIFRTIYDTYELQEFATSRPPPDGDGSVEWLPEPLLRRSSLMARRALWDLAAADLLRFAHHLRSQGRYRLLAAERAVLRRTFYWSDAAVDTIPDAAVYLSALRALPPELARDVRAALLWPFPYLARRALAVDGRKRLGTVLLAYRALATPLAAAGSLLGFATSKSPWTLRRADAA